MPTYAYKCTHCNHQLEAFQKISEDALKTCCQCGTESLKRIICASMASFQFKGSGFYITDYKKKSSKPKEKNKAGPS